MLQWPVCGRDLFVKYYDINVFLFSGPLISPLEVCPREIILKNTTTSKNHYMYRDTLESTVTDNGKYRSA